MRSHAMGPPRDEWARLGTDRPASGQIGPDRPASGQTGPPQRRLGVGEGSLAAREPAQHTRRKRQTLGIQPRVG